MYCTKCGAQMDINLNFCTSCGAQLNSEKNNQYYDMGVKEKSLLDRVISTTTLVATNKLKKQKKERTVEEISEEILKVQKKQLKLQRKQYNSIAKCPKCGSTSLSGHKKGFGIGKAVIGGAVAGPMGLVAGNIGSGKVKVTCLSCGKQFKL